MTLPLAARFAASVLGYKAMSGDLKHQAQLMQEAEAMNQLAREAEARRMGPVVAGLDRNAQIAEKIGADMAKLGFGAVIKGITGALKPAAGKLVKAVTPGWKTKALGTAAVLGTGYAGYKGLQAGRDYMMQPSGQGQPFLQGPKAHPNEFGY